MLASFIVFINIKSTLKLYIYINTLYYYIFNICVNRVLCVLYNDIFNVTFIYLCALQQAFLGLGIIPFNIFYAKFLEINIYIQIAITLRILYRILCSFYVYLAFYEFCKLLYLQ